jgi:hypothetical protein
VAAALLNRFSGLRSTSWQITWWGTLQGRMEYASPPFCLRPHVSSVSRKYAPFRSRPSMLLIKPGSLKSLETSLATLMFFTSPALASYFLSSDSVRSIFLMTR